MKQLLTAIALAAFALGASAQTAAPAAQSEIGRAHV